MRRTVVDMAERYLGSKDIADHFGIADSTVRSWRLRYDDFPAPDAFIGSEPGWLPERLRKIEEWEKSRPGAGARTDLKEEK